MSERRTLRVALAEPGDRRAARAFAAIADVMGLGLVFEEGPSSGDAHEAAFGKARAMVPRQAVARLASLLALDEEHADPWRDRYGLVEGRRSPRHARGALEEPLLEALAAELTAALEVEPRVSFAIAVSCDLDALQDDHLGEVLELLEGHGVVRPTFFVCAPSPDERAPADPHYDFADPIVRARLEPLREARDRVEVGLHGSYLAHDRPDHLRAQKARVEDWLGAEVRGHRAHYYRFAYPRSWTWQRRVGFAYDASLGYPDVPGLRSGHAAPIRFEDPEDGIVPFWIQPTILLDQHFQWPEPWEARRVEEWIGRVVARAAALRTVLCVDFHTYTLRPPFSWWSPLERLLHEARARGARLGGIAEVLAGRTADPLVAR